MITKRFFSQVLVGLFAVAAIACGPGEETTEVVEGNTAVREADPIAEENEFASLPDEVTASLASTNPILEAALNKVYRLEHRISVGPNKKIAVTETFTLRSWLRWPHRGMIMVPAQGSDRSGYNIPFDGYDGGAIMARQGFFAFSVDPPGTKDSYQPANGLTVTYENEAAVLLKVTDELRALRLISRLDAFGEELGGGAAIHMCADAKRIRSCTALSMLYKTGSEFFYQIAPFFEALILSSPDGYFTSTPESYFNVVAGAPPQVASWYIATQVGRYAAGPYKQDFDRVLRGGNSYNPRIAKVPGLIIRGQNETNNPLSDSQQLVADYGSTGGGHAELAIVPNGTHIVRLDAAPANNIVWNLTKEFVERPD